MSKNTILSQVTVTKPRPMRYNWRILIEPF